VKPVLYKLCACVFSSLWPISRNRCRVMVQKMKPEEITETEICKPDRSQHTIWNEQNAALMFSVRFSCDFRWFSATSLCYRSVCYWLAQNPYIHTHTHTHTYIHTYTYMPKGLCSENNFGGGVLYFVSSWGTCAWGLEVCVIFTCS